MFFVTDISCFLNHSRVGANSVSTMVYAIASQCSVREMGQIPVYMFIRGW